MAKNRPRRRYARKLLIASTSILLTGCPDDGPFGNLKAPDCDMDVGAVYCSDMSVAPDLSKPADLAKKD